MQQLNRPASLIQIRILMELQQEIGDTELENLVIIAETH